MLCVAAGTRCFCSPCGSLRLRGAPPGGLHAASGARCPVRRPHGRGEGEPYPVPGCCVCTCPPAPHLRSELLGEQCCRAILGNLPQFLSRRCPSWPAASLTRLLVLSEAPGAGFQAPSLKNSEAGGPHGHAAPSQRARTWLLLVPRGQLEHRGPNVLFLKSCSAVVFRF